MGGGDVDDDAQDAGPAWQRRCRRGRWCVQLLLAGSVGGHHQRGLRHGQLLGRRDAGVPVLACWERRLVGLVRARRHGVRLPVKHHGLQRAVHRRRRLGQRPDRSHPGGGAHLRGVPGLRGRHADRADRGGACYGQRIHQHDRNDGTGGHHSHTDGYYRHADRDDSCADVRDVDGQQQ
jgi:hypothetical protein